MDLHVHRRTATSAARLVGLIVVFLAVIAGCSSTMPGAGPITIETVPPTTAIARVGPADAARLRVAVPFSADRGALVVAVGAAPVGFSASAAEQEFSTILAGVDGDPEALVPHELLAGRVTLAPGLGTPPVLRARAWVVIYQPPAASCAPGRPDTTWPAAPPGASGLSALIFTEPGAVNAVTYQGAGTGACGPLSTKPTAGVGPGMS